MFRWANEINTSAPRGDPAPLPSFLVDDDDMSDVEKWIESDGLEDGLGSARCARCISGPQHFYLEAEL